MPDAQHISVKPLSGLAQKEARDTRARAWAYVFEVWHAKKGEHDAVTTSKRIDTGNKTREKTEQENT